MPLFQGSRIGYIGNALLLACVFSASLSGQVAGSLGHPGNSRITYSTAPDTGIISFDVFAERRGVRLDRQAVVKLVNRQTQSAVWQSTNEDSTGVFTDIPYGQYDAEISAVGYLSAHQELLVISTRNILQFDIVLGRDPSAANLDVTASILSPQARKESKKAISALKSGNLKSAQKHLDGAYKASPSDASVNFLLGYLSFEKADFAGAVTYLITSTANNPRDPQALTLLGRAGLEIKDYPGARSALEKAILADAENWLPHNLLANAYLFENNYSKASDEAHVAIAKGKGAASPAQLVLGEALLNLGDIDAGVKALTLFLQLSPHHPMAGQVRTLIAQVKLKNVDQSQTNQPQIKLSRVDPMLALSPPKLAISAWQPPGIDDIKLSVAPDAPCPVDKVVEESGRRVQELVEDVSRFAAVEDVFHQPLDEYGNPIRTDTRKFNYVAAISELQPGYLAVDEFRTDKFLLSEFPDNIASTGFAALALVFHPHTRDGFEMVCEGLGDWHGQASWLIHFRQRGDRPNHMHSYKVGKFEHAVDLKGRAWITADKFQIVRIEAEMTHPMPEIQLLSEHQVVEYGPVPFPQKSVTLWLPKSAEIYFDFRKHRYYRRHSFDHYMLYSVDSQEKRKEPTVAPGRTTDTPEAKKSS